LAAARVPALGCAELLAHLDTRFQLLGGNDREPRRTLRGAVDWSYALLAPEQQRLFRWLSVFAGSWNLDACRDVCADRPADSTELLNQVTDLVAKSLLTTVPTPTGMRYQLLETLRHYGLERLDECGEAEQARARYGQWACSLAGRARHGLRGPDEGVSGDLVRTELDNLRAAVVWSIADRDPDVAFTIVACLEDYSMLRLDFEVAAWAERLLGVEAWQDEPRRHRALGLVAHAAWARGDHDAATRWGQEAIALERRDDREPSWSAWQALGDAAWFRGRASEALEHFRAWSERASSVDDDFHLTVARTHLVVATTIVEPESDVLGAADDAVALARGCGTPSLIALALYAKGECLVERDPHAALALVSEGAAISRDSGNRFAFGLCLATLASLTGRLGEPAGAIALYQEAVENWHQAGNWANQRILLRNLAEFAPRAGAPGLTPRLLGAIDASGEMLGADISEEGHRLGEAMAAARRALGDGQYDRLWAEGAASNPHVLARETVEALEAMTVHGTRPGPRPGPLSRREWEVVALISGGLENREIASRLFISERTVDTHITRIRRKLGATTRTQVAVWGVDHGARASRTG
jgi:non-specific serine/threonine protein kinase